MQSTKDKETGVAGKLRMPKASNRTDGGGRILKLKSKLVIEPTSAHPVQQLF